MDSYAEQIVKKADSGSDNAKRVMFQTGGVLAGVLLIVIGMALGYAFVGVILGVAAFYGGLYMGTNYDIEYEYLIVNGEIDIDKILAKKRRKKLITVNVSSFENFGVYTDKTEDDGERVIVSTIGEGNQHMYFADFTHDIHGKCRLIFTPSDKVLREIKHYLKGNLRQVLDDLPDINEDKF